MEAGIILGWVRGDTEWEGGEGQQRDGSIEGETETGEMDGAGERPPDGHREAERNEAEQRREGQVQRQRGRKARGSGRSRAQEMVRDQRWQERDADRKTGRWAKDSGVQVSERDRHREGHISGQVPEHHPEDVEMEDHGYEGYEGNGDKQGE